MIMVRRDIEKKTMRSIFVRPINRKWVIIANVDVKYTDGEIKNTTYYIGIEKSLNTPYFATEFEDAQDFISSAVALYYLRTSAMKCFITYHTVNRKVGALA
jgi:hypothetical protein